MKNVIFIAPPAAGKGTQSKKLVELGYVHISAGDLLRKEVELGSEIGLKIKDILANGKLVADEISFGLIKKELSNLKKSFILDGYPRSIEQAELLNNLFNELNIKNYEVIYLDITMEEAMKRALGRLSCSCGKSYNINIEEFKPKKEGICDDCGRILTKRNDDNEESFKVRFETFLKNTEPIKDYYKSKNKLHIIDTKLDNSEITDRIKEILK